MGGISRAVQWLGLLASTAGVLGSIPSQGTKILQAVRCSQRKKKKKNRNDGGEEVGVADGQGRGEQS